MVKIGESENFQPRRKMTSSLKMVAFLEKKFLPKTQNFLFIAAVVKKLLQFESGRGPKSNPSKGSITLQN